MSAIIVVICLVVWLGAELYERATKNDRTLTDKEQDELLGKILGKSQKEARKIIRSYRRRG